MGKGSPQGLRVQVLWTKQARSHLKSIYEYILPENPSAAIRLVHRVEDAVDHLSLFLQAGRVGRLGTRELVVPKTEYIVAYGVSDSSIRILAVRRSARIWSEKFAR